VIVLDGSSLSLDDLSRLRTTATEVTLAPRRARASPPRVDVVDAFAQRDTPTYGINTGFGDFAEVKVAADSLRRLQINLLRSPCGRRR
jgi:histidine ammonia-lyase